MAEVTKRYVVFTGSNKGIGLEICKQLASKGIMVVLTARKEKRGLEAVEKLKEDGLSDNVVFHQLDVTDPASIASLVEFIKTKFEKLDVLVNNAGISGVEADVDALKAAGLSQNVSNQWAKAVLSDAENLTEQKVDEVLSEYMKDFKEGSLEAKGWLAFVSTYILSKAAMNAYTRILAKKYPNFCINCVCLGFVKIDVNYNIGILTVEEGAGSPVRLALLSDGGPSGHFFCLDGRVKFLIVWCD